MMRQLIFLQLFCVVSLGEVLGAARVTRESVSSLSFFVDFSRMTDSVFTFVVSASIRSNDTVCGLLKRETTKTDAPEGYQLALNVTCGGRRSYCTKLKNDIGHTCLKRWKTCLRSAFARVYDLKKVVSEDQKDYSIIFVRAFKSTTSLTDGYDESIEIIDRQFQTCLKEHALKVLNECTGNLTTEDEFLACNTHPSPLTMTTSKSILLSHAGILASIFGGIALGVIIVFVITVVTYRKVRPRPGDQDGLRLRKKRTQTPTPSGSSDERTSLLNNIESNQSSYDGQSAPPKETQVEVHPQPLPPAKPAQPNAQGLTPTPNDFGAGTLGGSHHVTIVGKKHSSSARRKTTSTSCPQSSSSDDGKKKHHTDVAHDRRRKKKVNRWLSNDDLQFVIDTGSSNGTSDSQPTSMESNEPSVPSEDATSSDNEHIA